MKLSPFDRKQPRIQQPTCMVEPHGATLRVVEQPAHVRAWEPVVIVGGEGQTDPNSMNSGDVRAKVEITAKRFNGNTVSQDRYEAMLTALDGSPSALMAALSRAVAEVDEFHVCGGADERVILQISVIR